MRKLLIFTFCLLFTACAGNRTLDGETTKNWVKIVSSKIDRSGNAQDVCFLLDLSFYPGTVYDRLKNNPSTCLEECCWYSENKNVEFYFNDGFIRELEDTGVSRRYYPDHIKIKMTYAPFLNRLSAKASSPEGITKDGVVMLEYDDIYKIEKMNDESFYEVQAKVFPEDPNLEKLKNTGPVYYKTISMSGLNRDELLARAKAERDRYYAKAVEERYVSPEKEYVAESLAFTNQVSPFDYPEDKEAKWLSKKTLAEEEELRLNRYKQNRYTDEEKALRQKIKAGKNANRANNTNNIKANEGSVYKTSGISNKVKGQVMYDVQRPLAQEAKIVYIEPVMPEDSDEDTFALKLAYERAEAVKLLKRFYGDEIDAYLRALDKARREKGQVLFTDDKVWQTQKTGTTIYKVICKVNGKIALLGTDEGTATTDYPIACGTYIVNLDEKTVEAKDDLAKKIAKKKY